MGVQIDEAGRYRQAFGVDLALARAGYLANCGDGVAVDGQVALNRGAAGAVHQLAAANYDVVCHVALLSLFVLACFWNQSKAETISSSTR